MDDLIRTENSVVYDALKESVSIKKVLKQFSRELLFFVIMLILYRICGDENNQKVFFKELFDYALDIYTEQFGKIQFHDIVSYLGKNENVTEYADFIKKYPDKVCFFKIFRYNKCKRN